MAEGKPQESRHPTRPLLGAHVSVAGGLWKAPHNGKLATCDVVQIFTRPRMQWRVKALRQAEVEAFIRAQEESGVRVVAAHAAYLINLASPDPGLFRKSREAFAQEMERCARLGIPNLVFHPGSHMGTGEEAGIRRVSEALVRLLETAPAEGPVLAVETTAGQGTSLGHRFEHLAEILERVDAPDRVALCLDTCHLFAAGYDFETPGAYRRTLKALDRAAGIDKVRVIHLNDSKGGPGSRVDRHEEIGKGRIGLAPFGFFLNDARLTGVPMILETPKRSHRDDAANLRRLRRLVKGRAREGR